MASHEVAILCGGLGTRLGALTSATPKPLLPIAGTPYLDYLLFELGRFGFRTVALLAGHMGSAIAEFAQASVSARRFRLELTVSIEPEPLGSAGALKFAEHLLAKEFILLNGDTWFDLNYLDLHRHRRLSGTAATIALCQVNAADRYNIVDFEGTYITRFRANDMDHRAGYISSGVVSCSRAMLARLPRIGSLESELWPALAEEGMLGGMGSSGHFLDIGVPDAFERAQSEIPRRLTRPAAFFEADALIGDGGCVGNPLGWAEGAIDAIRTFNDLNWYVFVVPSEARANSLLHDPRVQTRMRSDLAAEAAHIDGFGEIASILGEQSDAHKLRRCGLASGPAWPVDVTRSIVVTALA